MSVEKGIHKEDVIYGVLLVASLATLISLGAKHSADAEKIITALGHSAERNGGSISVVGSIALLDVALLALPHEQEILSNPAPQTITMSILGNSE